MPMTPASKKAKRVVRMYGGFTGGKLDVWWDEKYEMNVAAVFYNQCAARKRYEDVRLIEVREIARTRGGRK